jgi:hypothetical protein
LGERTTTSIPSAASDYVISPFTDVAVEHAAGSAAREMAGRSGTRRATVGRIVRMSVIVTGVASVFASDDARYASGTMAPPPKPPPPVRLQWSKYRGPGRVTFDNPAPSMETIAGGAINTPFSGTATTAARFTEPGQYVLHVLATDYSGEGGGGEVCCWTTAMVNVTWSRPDRARAHIQ